MTNDLTWKSTICTVLGHLQSSDANELTDAEFIDVLRAMQLISHKHGVNEHISGVIFAIADDSYSDKLLADLIEYVRDYD